MAHKELPRKGASRLVKQNPLARLKRISSVASSKKTARKQSSFASIISALKSSARLRRSPNKTAESKSVSTRPTPLQAAAPAKPIRRISVVRKSPRGPTMRTKRTTRSITRPITAAARSSDSRASIQSAADARGPAWYKPSVHPVSAAPAASPAHIKGVTASSREAQFVIPNGYNEDRIVLMVKDPWWVYAYWEIRPSTERAARNQLLPHEVADLKSILRVYDVTGVDFPAQNANRFFDISLSGMATNWYIQANSPDREFIVDIGFLTNTNRFILLARSNRIRVPRDGPSSRIDEEWACTDQDYWKLFGATAGIGMGASAIGLKELLERKIISSGLFSGAMFSPVKAQKARGFWLWVDAELIVYGATDPKASVTIQGQAIKLRPDGSFSVRMALPDGTQVIPVEATSPDGEETRSVTPAVTRQTSGHISMPARGPSALQKVKQL